MKRIFEKEKLQMLEQEKYFGLMLDKVSTGIVVVDNPDGHVAYSNTAALQILGVSSLVNLRQLSRISQELCDVFTMAARGRDGRLNFTNDMSSRTIAVKSSTAVIGGREMHIIVFNDISSEQNEIETESWTKLIRVLIHEIMNTVTPVVSLSDSLVRYSDECRARNCATASRPSPPRRGPAEVRGVLPESDARPGACTESGMAQGHNVAGDAAGRKPGSVRARLSPTIPNSTTTLSSTPTRTRYRRFS